MKVSYKERTHKTSKVILTILISLTLAFIWIHSMMPGEVSSDESGFFYDILAPFLKVFLPDEWVTEHLIRKMAHFSEYGLLGVEMTALAAVRDRIKPRYLVNVLFSGLAVAFIDETIQIFSGRGPMIADVWIDLAGFTTGGVVTLLAFSFRRRWLRSSRMR